MLLKCTKYFGVVALALCVLGLMTPAFGQQINTKGTVLGTDHDINGCVTCHAQHNAGGPGALLWAPTFSTTIFGVYTSDTMDSPAVEIGSASYSDAAAPTGAKMRSVLCMSCHDGITTTSLIGPTDGAAVGNPSNSAGLTDDHPINMAFDPAADGGLHTVGEVDATNVRLYDDGATPTVQCASCHDVHNGPGLGEFLRVSNANAGLCITCHL